MITLIKNIYWALTMCINVLLHLVTTTPALFTSSLHQWWKRSGGDQCLPELMDACRRARAGWGNPSFALALTTLSYLLWLNWCSLSMCTMNEIRERALTVKNTLFNRLQSPRSPTFWTNVHRFCVSVCWKIIYSLYCMSFCPPFQ